MVFDRLDERFEAASTLSDRRKRALQNGNESEYIRLVKYGCGKNFR